jgi:alpha-ketoglutarate-dependent taurine dioxygenase
LKLDQPFIENPPSLQLLHCIVDSKEGGDNYFSDARLFTNYIKNKDKELYEALTTKLINFHRKQKSFESLQIKPILEVDKKKV